MYVSNLPEKFFKVKKVKAAYKPDPALLIFILDLLHKAARLTWFIESHKNKLCVHAV